MRLNIIFKAAFTPNAPWNKGKLVGQKPPLKLQEVWSIRIRLEIAKKYRDLTLFNLAIDSKLRSCDLVKLKVIDIAHGNHILNRAIVIQQKTNRPVQFELTPRTQKSLSDWIERKHLSHQNYLFPSPVKSGSHITTRQYARVVKSWFTLIELHTEEYGTHSLRRTKATLIYKRTKNLRAVQLLLWHTIIESTVRYLGLEIDDALEMAEQTEV